MRALFCLSHCFFISATSSRLSLLPCSVLSRWQTYTYLEHEHASCKLLAAYDARIFHIPFFLASYLAPLCLSSGLYVTMLSRLWNTSVGGHISAESNRGRKRVTRMVVIVVVAFAGCWCPIQVYTM